MSSDKYDLDPEVKIALAQNRIEQLKQERYNHVLVKAELDATVIPDDPKVGPAVEKEVANKKAASDAAIETIEAAIDATLSVIAELE